MKKQQCADSDSSDDPVEERKKFIALQNGELDDMSTAKLAEYTKTKVDRQMKKSNAAKKMPYVCQGMEYKGPVIATHGSGPRENIFVVTNEHHSRHTNNGFSRP